MRSNVGLKVCISIGALIFIAIHIFFPDVNIDAITLGLLIVAVLPWLTSLIESAKFPGGWEVKFRDVQAAGDKITKDEVGAPLSPPSYIQIAEQDPNLALVGLRIEIEKRLRALAAKENLDDQRKSLGHLSRELINKGVLDGPSASGLQELIRAGNNAAHGARVEDGVAQWAIETGSLVLASLDAKLL